MYAVTVETDDGRLVIAVCETHHSAEQCERKLRSIVRPDVAVFIEPLGTR